MFAPHHPIALLALSCLIASGCETAQPTDTATTAEKDYSRPLPEGRSALRRVHDPTSITAIDTAWGQRDLFLRDAADESITWFDKPSTTQWFPNNDIDHARARASVVAFRDLITSAPDGDAFKNELLERFEVYESIGCDDEGTVLFTAYCSPTFEARRHRQIGYETPLYGRPDDLVTHPVSGEPVGRRADDGGITPWPTRKEIESSGMLEGTEVVWMANPLDAYIVHVNGSAKLLMGGEDVMYIGYAGKTERPYASLGAELVSRGHMHPGSVSLQGIRRQWRNDPTSVEEAMHANESYVFFQEYDGGSWPAGSLGFPVTAERSVATDKRIFPRGGVVLVDTTTANFTGESGAFTQYMLDQDTGGAIQAPGRADLYLGAGPMAELLSGRQKAEGRMYYFFLKDTEVANVNAGWSSPESLAAH